MSSVRQPDERQLLQPPQPWTTGFDNPQWMVAPPPYDGAPPSAPPALPNYYDQVPGNVQPTPQQLQRPLVVSVVSTPATVNTTTSVHVGAAPLSSSRRPPSSSPPTSSRRSTGCCGLTNKESAMYILYFLLAYSGVGVFSSFWALADGIAYGFDEDHIAAFIFHLPTSILFPCCIYALNGVFNEQTAGLTLLLSMLNVYWVFVFLMTICSLVGFIELEYKRDPIAKKVFILILFQLAWLCAVSAISKVLIGFRRSINRRRSGGVQ